MSCCMNTPVQTESAFSTMQVEVIALAICCEDIILIIEIAWEIGNDVELSISVQTGMHVCINKDRVGYLVLDQTLPPQ